MQTKQRETQLQSHTLQGHPMIFVSPEWAYTTFLFVINSNLKWWQIGPRLLLSALWYQDSGSVASIPIPCGVG